MIILWAERGTNIFFYSAYMIVLWAEISANMFVKHIGAWDTLLEYILNSFFPLCYHVPIEEVAR